MNAALALSLLCAAAVAGLLRAEWHGKPIARAVFKMCASTAFVLVALVLGALESTYGRLLLAALALGWLGDALLLSARAGPFLAGLAVFVLSHLCFALAFVAGRFAATWFALALLPVLVIGVSITRWLWPHLPNRFKAPVLAYIAVILVMCAAAAGFAAASATWGALLGAVLFAASDISVARDRFVRKSFANKAWGWPVYFTAQLTLAWTVAAAS